MNAAILLFALFMQGTVVAPRGQLQMGTAVRPETTTVGQRFVATVRVRVPVGTQIRIPVRPDSSAHVDSAGVTTRTDATVGGFTETTVNYVLAAWDTGSQRLGLDSIAVVGPNGERAVTLNGFQVYVRSVLPRDASLRVPKPLRPVIAVTAFNWLPFAIVAAAIVLALLALLMWRKWRRHAARGLTPLQVAERDFDGIESQRLIESGASERYAVEMMRVVRAYLASVVPAAAQSATTHELAVTLRHSRVVPAPRLIDTLDATDLIKFARQSLAPERAREIGAESRRIVVETAAALAAVSVVTEAAA